MRLSTNLKKRVSIITSLMFLASTTTYAQSTTLSTNEMTLYVLLSLVCLVALTVLLVAVYILRIFKLIIQDGLVNKAEKMGEVYVAPPSLWQRLNQLLTNSVPMEEESSIVLDHDYDGIKELDNHLPPWWTYLFYSTIVFAVVYFFIYHVFESMPLQTDEYNIEIAMAAEAKALNTVDSKSDIDENNVVFSSDPTDLNKGFKIFKQQCVACHKDGGGGGIGPNLTDEYWLHGGSMQNIFATIKYGVPEKGMISWEPLLSPTQMRDVSSYIYTLKGTNPPNPKAAQGELYVEAAAAISETDSTATQAQ